MNTTDILTGVDDVGGVLLDELVFDICCEVCGGDWYSWCDSGTFGVDRSVSPVSKIIFSFNFKNIIANVNMHVHLRIGCCWAGGDDDCWFCAVAIPIDCVWTKTKWTF